MTPSERIEQLQQDFKEPLDEARKAIELYDLGVLSRYELARTLHVQSISMLNLLSEIGGNLP
jgi:hypothetical protein